jgi:hypothetical protein
VAPFDGSAGFAGKVPGTLRALTQQQMPACHEQIVKRAGDDEAMSVLYQPKITHLGEAEQPFVTPIGCSTLARTIDRPSWRCEVQKPQLTSLWLSVHGLPMNDNAIYFRIVARTREGLGQAIHPSRQCSPSTLPKPRQRGL